VKADHGLRLAAAVLLAAVFVAANVACSKVSTRSSNRSAAGANPWTLHGVVRTVVGEEPNTLVRMFSNQSSADDVTALLFEPLFRYDENEHVVPALATEFPTLRNGLISKDGKRITFNLRPDAVWSDGVPVTAQDVIFTWHAIIDGNNPVVSTAGFDKIKTIIARTPHQVTMVLKEPYSPLVYLFSEGSFPPLPAHVLSKYKTLNNIPYDANPIGDGPFVLQKWLHGSDLIFAANPRYWRGPPRLREIDIKIVPNSNTQLDQLRTHEIDLLDGVSKPLISQLGTISGIWVVKQLQANYRHLDFNLKNPFLADVNVRRAIARAIDVPKILQTVYAGQGVVAATDIPPFSWAANNLPPIAYDVAAANRLLQSSGWIMAGDGLRYKNGQKLELSISTATDNRPNANAEAIIAQDLKAIGIALSIKNYAGAVLFAEHGPLYGGTYDMSWIVNTEGVDPDSLGTWGCDYLPPHGANTDFYCNRKVDALMRDAELQYDPERRRRDYEAAWKIMLDEVPSLMIYWDKNVVAGNTDLKNFKASPVVTDFWNAWEWEI
jgi:peptide/nickel transport system substrate-binding protein